MHATASLTMRDHAISLAHKGFRVFKLHENSKVSATKRFYEVASNDPDTVHAMWTDASGNPLNNNIGVLCGEGILVIDVDVKPGKRGYESLAALEEMGLDTATLTVATPSGGEHLYYTLSGNLPPFSGKVNKLGNGIDTRAYHNYVVGPGSRIGDKQYAWVNGQTLLPAPDWIEGMAAKQAWVGGGRDRRRTPNPLVDEDSDTAIARSTEWLRTTAPAAHAGDGGNQTTYRVACKLRDFGVSETTTLDLLLEHWNETKAVPPWDSSDLETIVGNAYRYAYGAAGGESADAEFEPVETTKPTPKQTPLLATRMDPFAWQDIPPRAWVMPGWLVREFVSGVVSPGGMGKTQLMIALCLAVASGSDKPFGRAPTAPTPVWYWNQEDNTDELRRRVAAAMQHFGLSFDDLGGRMYLDSGVEKPLILVKKTMIGLTATDVVDAIIRDIKAREIGAFIFDPLVEFHEAEENDNIQMRTVMAAARRIAVEGKCAVLAVAHSRKPPAASSESYAGDVDSLRGAGAQANVMRVAHTLYGMSEKDAATWGVSDEERHLYVRTDLAKGNLTMPEPVPRWWRRVSVPLGTMEGEPIGVLEPVELTMAEKHKMDRFEVIAKTISACPSMVRGQDYTYDQLCLELTAGEREAIGSKANFSRNVERWIDNCPGATRIRKKVGDPPGWRVETRFGALTVLIRVPRPGLTFCLEEVEKA